MKNPYEKTTSSKVEVLHPELQRNVDIVHNLLKERLNYDTEYTFSNDEVTFPLTTQQSLLYINIKDELITFCNEQGLSLDKTPTSLIIKLKNIDITV